MPISGFYRGPRDQLAALVYTSPRTSSKYRDTDKKACQNSAILRTANRNEDGDHRPASITSHD
jgi:hypothetical protein